MFANVCLDWGPHLSRHFVWVAVTATVLSVLSSSAAALWNSENSLLESADAQVMVSRV